MQSMQTRRILARLMQLRPPQANGFRILVYHSVRPVGAVSPSSYIIDPEQFSRQIAWLAEKNYHVVSLSAALASVRTGCALPPKTLVLSFDDGCRDNLTYAAPIVRAMVLSLSSLFVPISLGSQKEHIVNL